MRKLNGKNKIFIALFSGLIIIMIVILVASVFISQKNGSTVYNVSSNSVVFDSETNLIDTTKGGEILKRWDGSYYYINQDELTYELGDIPVVYEKTKDKIQVFGTNHLVNKDGSIIENGEVTEITDYSETTFYKLADREYLIISPEIYTEDKSIYSSKYLIVYIDKKGNASLLNDSINLKTINPMTLKFDNHSFDIANEKLLVNNKTIDLKLINGSTNEYVQQVIEPNDVVDVDMEDFTEQYNKLVNSFQQYVEDSSAFIGGAQTIFENNNFFITDGTQTPTTNTTTSSNNLTGITKMVSLRGAVAHPTHIDVTYSVSDVADQYQLVYILVSGTKNGVKTTEKILLDKYETTHRITGLSPRSEYTISLGYIERVKDLAGEWILQDQVEDVINVRTTKPEISVKVDKISKGYVYFTFKMTEEYCLDSGVISLYVEEKYVDHEAINQLQALSKNGYSAKMKLTEGSVMELRLEEAKYNGELVDLKVNHKFTY